MSYRPGEKRAGKNPALATERRCKRTIYREALVHVREARSHLSLLKQALQLAPHSPNGQVAEELLYTIVFQKLRELEEQDALTLLRLAREQQRAADGKEARRSRKPPANPVEQGREIRRRWRQLYGLDAPTENNEEADEESQPR